MWCWNRRIVVSIILSLLSLATCSASKKDIQNAATRAGMTVRKTQDASIGLDKIINATSYSSQKGTRLVDGNRAIGYFDNGDYFNYDSLNFDSVRSVCITYSKGNSNGKLELTLDGPDGEKVGEFRPSRTGSWYDYKTTCINIKEVEGEHDLTFKGLESSGVLNLLQFELSDNIELSLATKYKVNDNNGVDIQCRYSTLLIAFTEQVFNAVNANAADATDAEIEEAFYAFLGDGVTGLVQASAAVDVVCKSAQDTIEKESFDNITYDQGSQFVKLYYSGRASWNEETETLLFPSNGTTPVQVLKQDAAKVKEYYDQKAKKSVFIMPDLDQFDPAICTSHAAQCCWPRDRQAGDNNGNCNNPYDSNCVDKDVGDNTDLCYSELDKAPYANGIDANGYSVYDDEGAIHCHGFAWSPDDREVTSRFKANALFFVSMYDHMHNRGYVGHIPGSPMCGCVEHMPVVTRADCTQTDVEEHYTFTHTPATGVTGVVDGLTIAFSACQGANNKNNDLNAFVQQLVNDEKLSAEDKDAFNTRVIGNNQCPTARDELLEQSGFESGFTIDEERWTYIVGEEFGDDKEPILDARLFKDMFMAQDVPIVRRVCPHCRAASHKDTYYRRLTDMPDDFDLLDTLMNNWMSKDNMLNVDFAIYSSHLDAYYDTNRWQYCNYDDKGIGFPRDCGPSGRVSYNWNSYYRGGGYGYKHAFLLPANTSFQSTVKNIALGKPARQQGVYNGGVADRAVDGDTVGIYNWGGTTSTDYQEDPYWQVDLESNSTIDKVYFWRCLYGCRNTLANIRVDVYDTPYGDPIATQTIEGNAQVMNVVSFGNVTGQAIRLTAETTTNQRVYMSLAEVQVDGTSGVSEAAPELFASVDADEYEYAKGIYLYDGGETIGSFDKGDEVTYSSINFQSVRSVCITYSKGSTSSGHLELRLGDSTGEQLGEFRPSYTGGWDKFKTECINIVDSEGEHDLTFVARDTWSVLNLKKFYLSPTLLSYDYVELDSD